jgi:hypothetical protein
MLPLRMPKGTDARRTTPSGIRNGILSFTSHLLPIIGILDLNLRVISNVCLALKRTINKASIEELVE